MLYVKVLGSIPPEWYAAMFKITYTTEGAGFQFHQNGMLQCPKSLLQQKVLSSIPMKRYAVMFKIRFTTEGDGFSSTRKSMLCCSNLTCLRPGFKSNKQVPAMKIYKTCKTKAEVEN